MKDLLATIGYVSEEITYYEQEIKKLQNQQKETDKLIDAKSTPKIHELKTEVSSFKELIKWQKEVELLEEIARNREKELINVEISDDEDTLKYKPRELLADHVPVISDDVLQKLSDCHFDDLTTARFDKDKMDVVVNGVQKSEYGKGYRAFINTILSLVLLNLLQKKGRYTPGFAVYDSPILSLKEKTTKLPSESMRKALFLKLTTDYKDMQIIVLENEIPKIDYGNTNLT